jgi:hypothetical protein
MLMQHVVLASSQRAFIITKNNAAHVSWRLQKREIFAVVNAYWLKADITFCICVDLRLSAAEKFLPIHADFSLASMSWMPRSKALFSVLLPMVMRMY